MVVAAAGNLDHATVVRQVRKAFGRNGFLARDEAPVAAPGDQPGAPGPRRRQSASRRPFEQVNLVLGVNGLTRNDDRRYALGVLNTALGGGTSSRLFQEVRERRGLAYSRLLLRLPPRRRRPGRRLGRLPAAAGSTTCSRPSAPSSRKVAADGITDDELERGKGQLRGGLVLGLEDSGSRMSRHRQGRAGLRRAALASTRSSPGSTPSPLDDVRAVAAAAVRPARDPRRRRPPPDLRGRRPIGRETPRGPPGAGDGPQHAGEGADDEAFGGGRGWPTHAAPGSGPGP